MARLTSFGTISELPLHPALGEIPLDELEGLSFSLHKEGPLCPSAQGLDPRFPVPAKRSRTTFSSTSFPEDVEDRFLHPIRGWPKRMTLGCC